ncbi:hypothetical protein ACH5RR_003992 [Cinchona calisaya]|uniref:Glucan endo-1,3-beta-D-glucosidase n=1 Tax=Cinchona calisaya TaxID=153742 RepID=A0ABD3AWG5_9GENT
MGEKVDIGVTYPRFPEDEPSEPVFILDLYKLYGIGKIRLYSPVPDALEALRDSNIDVAMGIPNDNLAPIATSLNFTKSWYSQFVEPYINNVRFTFIIVGNNAIPGVFGKFVAPAMNNLQTVLDDNNLGNVISVTTAIGTRVLRNRIPPSAAVFSPEALNNGLAEVIVFLENVASHVLMVNVYPYYDYIADPVNNRLDFVQFATKEVVLIDNNLNYTNLYDATLDAYFWALERAGGTNVYLSVAETGWPTAGNGNGTTPGLASKYNNNLVKHVVKYAGTPKKPGPLGIEAFIFGMFDENVDPDERRRNFGIFTNALEPAYPLFNSSGNEIF